MTTRDRSGLGILIGLFVAFSVFLALTTREPGDLIRELLLCSQGQE